MVLPCKSHLWPDSFYPGCITPETEAVIVKAYRGDGVRKNAIEAFIDFEEAFESQAGHTFRWLHSLPDHKLATRC